MITENTAKASPGENPYVAKTIEEILNPPEPIEEEEPDDRTAVEFARDMWKRMKENKRG